MQQDVEHIGVSLLYLIEEHHAVRLAPHGFGELAAFIVTHVARRRADQAAHAELLLVFAHVDTRHHVLVVEEVVGQGLGQLSLAHARRTEEDERTDGAFRVLKSGSRPAHCIGHRADGFVLSHDTLVQFLLQVEQFFAFALQHAGHGYAGPAGHHFGNVVGGHFLLHHGFGPLSGLQLLLPRVDVVLQLPQFSVAYLRHAAIVAFALGAFGFKLQLLHLLLVLLDAGQHLLLAFPFGSEVLFLLLQFGNVAVESVELLRIIFPLDGLAFNFELAQASGNLVQFLRLRVPFHAELGCRFVHQVDGLVRQEAVRNVAV